MIRFVTGKKARAKAIISVKGGKQLMPGMVRDLEGVVSKTKDAEMGVLITLHSSTKGMRDAAATGGTYHDAVGNAHPKIQIISVEELLLGQRLTMPPVIAPYTEAQKTVFVTQQLAFGIDEDEDMPAELEVMPDEAADSDE